MKRLRRMALFASIGWLLVCVMSGQRFKSQSQDAVELQFDELNRRVSQLEEIKPGENLARMEAQLDGMSRMVTGICVPVCLLALEAVIRLRPALKRGASE